MVDSTKAKMELDIYMVKSFRIDDELMCSRSMFRAETMSIQGEILAKASEMIGAGTIRHVMTESFGPMTTSSLAKAHGHIEQGRMIGKMALSGIRQR